MTHFHNQPNFVSHNFFADFDTFFTVSQHSFLQVRLVDKEPVYSRTIL